MNHVPTRGAGPSHFAIAGAGVGGLAAAITLARAGCRVVVHERRQQVGHRFGGDYQGLENWTTQEDVLSLLKREGITGDFPRRACYEGTVFGPDRSAHTIRSQSPIFYMIERGPGPRSLDTALLSQALELGAEVRFNSRLDKVDGPGIIASGPKAADAIAVGYHFSTDMADGFWAICDDRLAPQGYAYLLVWNGRGTVKSCMFSGFKEEKEYVARTVTAFEELLGLQMSDPVPHGGFGNLHVPRSAKSGPHPLVGEHAGFQDTLWGFGIRFALLSGVLAARSLLTGEDYDESWRRELGAQLKTGVVNRAFFSLLGNRNYGRFIQRIARAPDPRTFLRRHYGPSIPKRLLTHWARHRFTSQRTDASCNHVDCHCVWCRHGKDHGSEGG